MKQKRKTTSLHVVLSFAQTFAFCANYHRFVSTGWSTMQKRIDTEVLHPLKTLQEEHKSVRASLQHLKKAAERADNAEERVAELIKKYTKQQQQQVGLDNALSVITDY